MLDNEKQIRFKVIGKQTEKKNLTNLFCLLNRKSGLYSFVQSPRPKCFRYITELVYILLKYCFCVYCVVFSFACIFFLSLSPFSLFETTQTLFWAVFGLVDLDSFELEGIKIFTRFWGMLMFGTYSVINIVVLLNLLIAMMNHSYQLISVSKNGFVCLWI